MLTLARTINEWSRNLMNNSDLDASATRPQVVTFTVAMLTAHSLPLPPAKIDQPREWWTTHADTLAKIVIGKLNEHTIFNYDAASALSYKIWLGRYNAVHRPFSPEAVASAMSAIQSNDSDYNDIHKSIMTVSEKWITSLMRDCHDHLNMLVGKETGADGE